MQSASTTARITLLNGFTLHLPDRVADGAVVDLPRGVQRLLAHLSLTGRPARSAVAGQLWPEVPEASAGASLRSTLWRLQRAAPGLVVAAGGALCLAETVRVDVREFAAQAHRVLDPGCDLDGTLAAEVADSGELLPGWYDDWVLLQRERLRQLRMHVLEALAGRLADLGRYAEALEAAYAAVQVEPLRESAHRAVVRVHLAEGNVAEALRAYGAFRSLLAEELGVGPTRHMDELVRAAIDETAASRGSA